MSHEVKNNAELETVEIELDMGDGAPPSEPMRMMSIEAAVDYLEEGNIHETFHLGHAVVQVGVSAAGHQYVMLHDYLGNAVVSEAL